MDIYVYDISLAELAVILQKFSFGFISFIIDLSKSMRYRNKILSKLVRFGIFSR